MALFRKVHTSFWSDTFIQNCSPEKKYFFLYLLTNERTKLSGIYEITKRQMSYDTGYNVETVTTLIKHFVDIGKIKYNEETNEMAIKNWFTYNSSTSPKVEALLKREFKDVKDKSLLTFVSPK